ncbi:MAG TPA: C2 domain-containing protein, partial [Myxococcota bacterium]|nr:C2 domain-containing protein [Myxococcota bacterium]
MRKGKWTIALMLVALLAGCGGEGGNAEDDCTRVAMQVYQAVGTYCLGRDCCQCDCVTQGKYPLVYDGDCTCLTYGDDHTFEDGSCTLDLIDYVIPENILSGCIESSACGNNIVDVLDNDGWCGSCTPATCPQLGHECGSWDDGCGGQAACGSCPTGETCDGNGLCVGGCTPTCTGRECGPDPTCGQSCGTCPTGQGCDATGRCTCASHAVCDSSSLCIGGDCVPAYGRRYTFTIVSATVSDYDQSGDAWDFPGGMPDPIVRVYRNSDPDTGQPIFSTTEKSDNYNPVWNESFQEDIYATD